MKAALWLLALFGVAVAIALFAGNNQGTITVFWPPHRVDLSLNLVLLLLFAAFVFIHAVLRALSALLSACAAGVGFLGSDPNPRPGRWPA